MIYQGKQIIAQYLGTQSIARKYLGDALFWESVNPKEEIDWTVEATFGGYESTSSTILYSSVSLNIVERMAIDGVEITPTKTYVFGDKEKHTVQYKFTHNNVPNAMFYTIRGIQSVKILNAESVGSSAFADTFFLYDLYVSKSVKSIASDAFDNTSVLRKITVEDGNTAFYPVEDGSLVEIATNKLLKGTYKCVIPEGVKKIGAYAFYNNKAIETAVVIPDSVEDIGFGAFWGCDEIPSLTLGASVETVGQYAFGECSKLSEITVRSFSFSGHLTSFEGLPEEGRLYYPCGSLYEDWLESFGSGWVGDCITFVEEVTDYDIIAEFIPSVSEAILLGNTANVAKMFVNDVEVAVANTYKFPLFNTVNKVKYKLIDNTQIGNNTFKGCADMTDIAIPDTITTINDNAFYSCYSLTSIELPETVTTIGSYAFWSLYRLTSITIPENVTYIGKSAFEECSGLAEITCNATTAPSLGEYAFRYVPETVNLYYPCDSDYSTWISALGCENTCGEPEPAIEWDLEVYYTSSSFAMLPTYFYTYGDNVERMWVDGVEVTPSASYNFGDTLQHTVAYKFKKPRIQGSMFSGRTNVQTVTIYPTVQEIGVRAFKGCTKMTSIVLRGAPPTLAAADVFEGASTSGTLYSPNGYDCSEWLSLLGDGWSEVKYDV